MCITDLLLQRKDLYEYHMNGLFRIFDDSNYFILSLEMILSRRKEAAAITEIQEQ